MDKRTFTAATAAKNPTEKVNILSLEELSILIQEFIAAFRNYEEDAE